MKEEASEMQASCSNCCLEPAEEEGFTTTITEDWRSPYMEYLIDKSLLEDCKHAYKINKKEKRYFLDRSTLYRNGFNGEPLKCLGISESQQVLQEVHAWECGKHQGKKKLYNQLLNLGYFWSNMRKDAHDTVKKCHTCQIHANLSHKPPKLLQDMAIPYLVVGSDRDYSSTFWGLHMDLSRN
ncbi:uncharacterized protein LOC126802632 [Argentina anserina]|uniref:uncharacterized protein LOC126802632 n=1 Tax=Argentina anserina TaxID=57926 RepID=UPI002176874F|nr:uncharacterized protein LOC126802632 [Potentilla anserina]